MCPTPEPGDRSESPSDRLARALASAASDDEKTRQLHAIFGGFCHEVRNVLNSLHMSLYLARKSSGPDWSDLWTSIEPGYQLVERFIDRFQTVCRPFTICPVKMPLGALFDDRRDQWSDVLAGQGRELRLEPKREAGVPVPFEPQKLGSAFDDLVAWRAALGPAGTALRACWWVDQGQAHVEWDEPSGEGPRPRKPSTIKSKSGRRPETALEAELYAALTIPLLTRIVRAQGGSLESSSERSWCVRLKWPIEGTSEDREMPTCSASPT